MKRQFTMGTKNILWSSLLTLTAFLWSGFAYSQLTYKLTSGTSWTVPDGVYAIKVECIGGGGGGGRSESSGQATGGGGGGAFASSFICVQPYQVINYGIGQGGAAGDSNKNGGDTWFGGNAGTPIIKAAGGKGVTTNATSGGLGGDINASIGDIKYKGGNGGNGTGNGCSHGSGGGGGAAGNTGNGYNGQNGSTGVTSGNGGNGGNYKPNYGGAGGAGTGSDGTGDNASTSIDNFGGGGGGAKRGCASVTKRDGGKGTNGGVIITILIKDVNAGDSMDICAGQPVQLNGSVSSANMGDLSFQWSGNSIIVGDDTQHPTINPSSPTDYVFTVSVGDCSTSDTVSVGLLPSPEIDLPDVAELCKGTSLTLQSGNTDPNTSVSWSDGSTNNSLVVTEGGSYSITLTNDLGCTTSHTVLVLETNPPTAGNITANLLANGSYKFTSSANGADSYLWDFGDGNTSSEPSPTHQYTSDGEYNVTLTISNSCGEKSTSTTVNVKLGLSNWNLEKMITIFPNPAKEYIILESDNNSMENIYLYTISGQQIIEYSLENKTNYKLNINELAKGFYFAKIKLTNGTVVQKKFQVN